MPYFVDWFQEFEGYAQSLCNNTPTTCTTGIGSLMLRTIASNLSTDRWYLYKTKRAYITAKPRKGWLSCLLIWYTCTNTVFHCHWLTLTIRPIHGSLLRLWFVVADQLIAISYLYSQHTTAQRQLNVMLRTMRTSGTFINERLFWSSVDHFGTAKKRVLAARYIFITVTIIGTYLVDTKIDR